MLESITLQHFKGYENYRVIFPPGLTIITGANYSGKTRLLHAILFAFWGVSAVPGGSKLVPSRGHKPSDTLVTAQFYHQKETYRIERKVASARLYRNEDLVATSTSAVNKELESVLNTPQKFFLRLKYAEQSETQALLTLGAAELHKVIEHVSGANLVNHVIERASKAASIAQAGLDTFGPLNDMTAMKQEEQELAAALRVLHKELEQAKQVDAELQALVTKAESELQSAEKNNELHLKRVQEYQRWSGLVTLAKANLTTAEHEIASYQTEASRYDDLAKEQREAQQRLTQWNDLQHKLQAQRNQVAHSQARMKQAEADLATASKELSDLGTHDNTNAFQALLDAEVKYQTALAKTKELEQACENAVCPTCGRPFDDKDTDALVSQWKDAVGESEAKGVAYSTAVEYSKQEEAKMLAIAAKKRRVEALSHEHTRLTDEIVPQEMKLVVLETEIANAKQPPTAEYVDGLNSQVKSAAQAAGAVASAQKRMANIKARLEMDEKMLSNLPPAPDLIDTSKLSEQTKAWRQQAKDASRTILSKTSAYGIDYARWNQLSSQLEAETARQEKIAKLQREKDTAASLAKYLRGNRDRFLQELWGQVMGYASDFSATCTGGAIERVERTTDGAFQFIEAGELAMIEGASGAQKSIMSIGVQLALDTLLPDTFGALLMDEPTSQMDVERSLMLTQTLAQTGRQIIMVSHREMDATVAQSHIHLE